MNRKTRVVNLGGVLIGGGNPVVVQSMTNTDTRDTAATVAQIKALEASGCELVRVAVVDQQAAQAIAAIKKQITVPLVADIHFDYRLALQSIASGCDGLRLNPGNIGAAYKVQEVVRACQDRGIPIRIGVNAGSLDKSMAEKHGGVTAKALVESALMHISILEAMNFANLKISLKASSVPLTIAAYRLISQKVDYPLHIGITEAGTMERGLIKSSLGLGILLAEGIGDTMRVSLTAAPVHEVWAAYEILRALDLRQHGPELISCPTCGRCEIDLIKTAERIDQALRAVSVPIKVAVMGCVVNGPGEAREADIGVAGGKEAGLLFKKGEIIRKVPEAQLVEVLLAEIAELQDNHEKTV
ncbi:MAG: flavodoxin-dependent (E)-4-hydroxy-3-methylbut-2-enyl-diphosphate synthase [Syntrophomonadaceae bacterium]|jgi:(E)-4-hydroxy-3-methylbut-2-enyl-diphosphate synthase